MQAAGLTWRYANNGETQLFLLIIRNLTFERWGFFLCVFCVFQPERIDPSASRQGYDVRSDVWSLGITLVSQCFSQESTFFFVGQVWIELVLQWEEVLSVCSASAFSMSWQQEGFLTRSGIAFLTSWRRWWKVNLRSLATRRRGSSPQSSSTLLTYGEDICNHSTCALMGFNVIFVISFSLTKDESKRPKYRELLVRFFIYLFYSSIVFQSNRTPSFQSSCYPGNLIFFPN